MDKSVFKRVDCVTLHNGRWMFIPLSNDVTVKVKLMAVYLHLGFTSLMNDNQSEAVPLTNLFSIDS